MLGRDRKSGAARCRQAEQVSCLRLIQLPAELDAECALHLAEDGVVGDGTAALVLVHDGLLLVDARREVFLRPALCLTALLDAQRHFAAHMLDCVCGSKT